MTTSPATGPTLAAPGAEGVPQFATVMRGFDRGQVEDYVVRLNDFLVDAEQRAKRAEQALSDLSKRNDEMREAMARRGEGPEHRYDGLGARIESMLRLAAEEAAQIRRDAQEDAKRTVAEARQQRESEVGRARQELADVTARRDDVVEELRKVQDALTTLGLRQHLTDSTGESAPHGSTASDRAGQGQPAAAPDTAPAESAALDGEATRVITLPDTATASTPG